MDERIAAIKEKTGLPADKAKGVAEAAVDFLTHSAGWIGRIPPI